MAYTTSLQLDDRYCASESIGLTREWARRLHGAQKDKDGNPYLHHLDAVALNTLRLFGFDETLIKVAYLHDALEDTACTMKHIADEGYEAEERVALFHITKGKTERNYDYMTRVLTNEIAMKVKLADITHNSDPDRLGKLPQETQDRLKAKYLPGKWRLERALGIEPTVTFSEAHEAAKYHTRRRWNSGKATSLIPGDLVKISGVADGETALWKVVKKEVDTKNKIVTILTPTGALLEISSDTSVSYLPKGNSFGAGKIHDYFGCKTDDEFFALMEKEGAVA